MQTATMEAMAVSPEREERRRQQRELADRLTDSGAMDEIFSQLDAGVPLSGEGGLIGGMLKAALERGPKAELTEHLGYEKGNPNARLFPNSRNGVITKTLSTEIGDIELDTPRIEMELSRRCWWARDSVAWMDSMG